MDPFAGATSIGPSETSDAAASIQEMLPRLLATDIECLSPFLLHAIYKSAIGQVKYEKLPPSIEQPDYFQNVKAALLHLSERWKSAGASSFHFDPLTR